MILVGVLAVVLVALLAYEVPHLLKRVSGSRRRRLPRLRPRRLDGRVRRTRQSGCPDRATAPTRSPRGRCRTATPAPAAGGARSLHASGGVVAVVRRGLTGRAPEADRDRAAGRSPGGEARLDRHPRLDPDEERRRARPCASPGARARNVGALSVLNSSNRRPLRGGYWVVYSGPYATLGAVSRRARRHPRGRLPDRLHPRADRVPVTRLRTCLRAEEGMTLIELLIAMIIMAIGIAALVAGFSSGILSVNRARLASTAGRSPTSRWSSTARRRSPRCRPCDRRLRRRRPARTVTPTGCRSTGAWTCAVGTYSAGPPASCSGTPASRPVKLVTINVRDGSATAKLLFTESATFDSSTG